MTDTGIVICTRLKSSRIPNKPLIPVAGKPLIEHLIRRVKKTGLLTILAAPENDISSYWQFLDHAEMYSGYDHDPLKRMTAAAIKYGLKTVVRVTHDKVFVDPNLILRALDHYNQVGADYLYSDQFTDGAAFEIISTDCLKRCAAKYRNVEYISYAARELSKHTVKWDVPRPYQSKNRFLVDYPEDINVIEAILTENEDAKLIDAIYFANHNPWLSSVNFMPWVTVYTCGYNASAFIEKCFKSVVNQTLMPFCEYIMVDDNSVDDTFHKMLRISAGQPNIKVIRNQKNLGLASSSNVALSQAKGKYIIRLDADDVFASADALMNIYNYAVRDRSDIIYPDYYDGNYRTVEKGSKHHHPAGALFSTRALNYVRFTDGLRGYDGLDLYMRAKDKLTIGYYDSPIFFYTHRTGSLSRSNDIEREKIRDRILNATESTV